MVIKEPLKVCATCKRRSNTDIETIEICCVCLNKPGLPYWVYWKEADPEEGNRGA